MRARTYTPYSEIAHCGQPADGLYIIKQVIARVASGKEMTGKLLLGCRLALPWLSPACLLELKDSVIRVLIVYVYADNGERLRRGWRTPQIFAEGSFGLFALETTSANSP